MKLVKLYGSIFSPQCALRNKASFLSKNLIFYAVKIIKQCSKETVYKNARTNRCDHLSTMNGPCDNMSRWTGRYCSMLHVWFARTEARCVWSYWPLPPASLTQLACCALSLHLAGEPKRADNTRTCRATSPLLPAWRLRSNRARNMQLRDRLTGVPLQLQTRTKMEGRGLDAS